MPRRTRVEPLPPPRLVLHSLVDVVFLLLVFFVVSTEFNPLPFEELALPVADQGTVPPWVNCGPRAVYCGPHPLEVSVLRDGTLRLRGKTMVADPERRGAGMWLSDYLRAEVAGYSPNNDGTSRVKVEIRANRDVPFEHVQKVLAACAEHSIAHTHFAVRTDQE